MSTVGALMDRIYREWLHKLGNQPLSVALAETTNAGDLAWALDEGMTPEELSYINPGVVLECGTEQVRVHTWDSTSRIATFRARGYDGTAASDHAAGAIVYVDPPYPRNVVLGALGDEIVGLHPELWAVVTVDAELVGHYVAELPVEAEGVLYAQDLLGNTFNGHFLSNYSGVDSGRAVIFDQGAAAYVTYSAGFLRPSAEATELSALRIEDRWQQLLIVSTVSSLLRGQELDLTTLEFLTEAIEASGIRLGSPTDVATALLRWRAALVGSAKAALLARTGIPVVMNRVI